MELIRHKPGDAPVIHGYGDRGFRINGIRYEGTVLVLGGEVEPADVAAFEDIGPALLDHIAAAEPTPEILLVGCGPAIRRPGPEWRARLQGIAIETMDTGAACRTFNVLAAEGRIVAALLVAVP